MRYVDTSELLLPDDWFAAAKQAKQAVQAGADPGDYAKLWRELKDALARAVQFCGL